LELQTEDKEQSYFITKKLFALINENNIVVNWYIGSLEECKEKNPELNYIEMTEENSPATVGSLWNGKNFII
jgi:hypothetical protein